mmetsp:Transcript_8909/g.17756  ORF Transcript_8909/g.17756 Transcript_8909/m.17756 type:complete len:347 (-) Transcript_8909:640-1680(-)
MRVLSPALRLLLLAAADAFSPISIGRPSTILHGGHIGSGGMADTRNPDTIQHEDPRKSISAAPSFEEYLKQRANEGTTAATAPPKPIAEGDFDATAAISAMETSQTKTVGDIASAIPDLAPKPDQSYAKNDGFTAMGNAVSLQASDAPGPANVAWISDLSVDGALSSLTIFNGPLSDVPHLIQRCFINEGMLHFFLDVRPRAYGAHDLRDADGNYPGPETLGRKAFEYSGARKDYDTKFGTEELISLLDDTVAKLEGVTKNPGLGDEGLSELEKVTLGPLAVDISMPLTSGNVDSIIGLREKVASMWLGWATDDSHAHRPGAPVNSQYVYDTKYRVCYHDDFRSCI